MGRDAVAARLQVDALRQLSAAGLFFEPWLIVWPAGFPLKKIKPKKACNKCARGWRLFRWWGPRSAVLRSSCFWRRAMPEQARWKRRWLRWIKRWRGWAKPASACSKRKRTGCAGSCCWPAGPRGRRHRTLPSAQPPRRVSAARSPWPGSRGLDGGNCAPRSACAGCSKNRTDHKMRAEPKLTKRWRRSTAGSPRDSKCRIMREARALLAEASQRQTVTAGS